MKYSEILKEEYIEDYKKQHRIIYQGLSSMIFDIYFLKECVALQNPKLEYDWITIKSLHRNIFENLVLKTYKYFYDEGSDALSINRFKNNVFKNLKNEDDRNDINEKIKALSFKTEEFSTIRDNLDKSIRTIRTHYIAHRLLSESEEVVANVEEIEMLFEYGCKLLELLTFEPDFYTFIEGDGHTFTDEIEYEKKSTERFIKTCFLSSKQIQKISCELKDDCDEDIKKQLEALLSDLNSNR